MRLCIDSGAGADFVDQHDSEMPRGRAFIFEAGADYNDQHDAEMPRGCAFILKHDTEMPRGCAFILKQALIITTSMTRRCHAAVQLF